MKKNCSMNFVLDYAKIPMTYEMAPHITSAVPHYIFTWSSALHIHNYKIKISSQGWKDGWAVKSVNFTAGQLGLAPSVPAMWRFPSSSTCSPSSRGADTFGTHGPLNSHVHTPRNMQHTNMWLKKIKSWKHYQSTLEKATKMLCVLQDQIISGNIYFSSKINKHTHLISRPSSSLINGKTVHAKWLI